jgi:predicted RNA-binding Zn ribbon-like protein
MVLVEGGMTPLILVLVLRRQDLTPDDRRRFRSGRPSIDLIHTGGDGELATWEILDGDGALAAWLGLLGEVEEVVVAPGDLEATKALRRALGAIAFGLAAGAEPRDADVAVVNGFAAAPSLVPALGADGARSIVSPAPASAVLSSLARDAIDLLTSPLRDRVRVCAADNCGLLFVDASRPGRRRWCSMERCGNMAKTKQYRRRGGAGAA